MPEANMPGKYGPGGKWIHDRAHRIMQEGDTMGQYGERGKSVAYAIATEQAHKLGKSPKGFRTSQGVRKAKQKFDLPQKEYQKTAGIGKELRDPRLYSNIRGAFSGESKKERIKAHRLLNRRKRHGVLSAMKEGWTRGKNKVASTILLGSNLPAFFDEVDTISKEAGWKKLVAGLGLAAALAGGAKTVLPKAAKTIKKNVPARMITGGTSSNAKLLQKIVP